jgi:NADPH-dependent glutamate synthase beta subunit-like oxidoreductase/NAD(P)H-flavin reductase
MSKLHLSFDFCFKDLYEISGLRLLDQKFLKFLNASDESLFERLLNARQNSPKNQSELLIAIAPYVEDFLSHLFQIEKCVRKLQEQHHQLAPVYAFKRQFIQRRAAKKFSPEQASGFDSQSLKQSLETEFKESFSELTFARHVMQWLSSEETYQPQIEIALGYAAWASLSPEGKLAHKDGFLFKLPQRIDPHNLISFESQNQGMHTRESLPREHLISREGFQHRESKASFEKALDQAHYCIGCHKQNKDSCSKGLKDPTTHSFQTNIHDIVLSGCPLEVKVSEMNIVKAQGLVLGALAIIMIDNPMVAATGDRICNDCMKACIFQKQDPVDVPMVETQILKDVLSLPWGFEIYSLLARWNPLNFSYPFPKNSTGYKVLVVGMGPAGFTLAHHLLNEGHTVVAIDGLKIEPFPLQFTGSLFEPIQDVTTLYESLDERIMAGFGGVAEYGITVRWNKNFLKLIRLLLERRQDFHLFGNVRFGGTLTPEQAFEMGFDHIALCTGAGQPKTLPLKNFLVRGVRQASDFLMSLQLTGAAKMSSIANLQLRLPALVIGGGLTAIDTATEALAYYPLQVEKFLRRYESLVDEIGEDKVHKGWNKEEKEIAEEFLTHAHSLRLEHAQAFKENRTPDILGLLNKWGGITIIYRNDFKHSPSYRLNPEEVFKALQEGIQLTSSMLPKRFSVDGFRHVNALIGEHNRTEVSLPARSILIATGTRPNTVLVQEYPNIFQCNDNYLSAIDSNGLTIKPELTPKPGTPQILTARMADGRGISFFGDLHPSYAGNVVKAMASAKQGYPLISEIMLRKPPQIAPNLIEKLNSDLVAYIHTVTRLTSSIIEIIVHAPLAAANFKPGQFYRLQNFESSAQMINGTKLAFEAIALTGASVDIQEGLISLVVLEMGGSSRLCTLLRPSEPIALMGPTGSPTEIVSNQKILLIGGGLGNAVLFSIGHALRAQGCQVLYAAGYHRPEDLFKRQEIERAADIVLWCCEQDPSIAIHRPQDRAFKGTVLNGLQNYVMEGHVAEGSLDRMIVIGSDRMMAAASQAKQSWLKPFLSSQHVAIASINSPMQCMMKGICGQCLQSHTDPLTGQETTLFSCMDQDQSLTTVDFNSLKQRLNQNGASEKLTDLWIQSCLRKIKL